MSISSGLLHHHLRWYKGYGPPTSQAEVAQRARLTGRLAALTALFLQHHAGCLGAWDVVTTVPSATRSAPASIIARVRALRGDYAELLSLRPQSLKLARDRFAVTQRVTDQRVLLFDDTFTSGKSVFAATAALRDAGALVVGPLLIGRHINPGWEPSDRLLGWLSKEQWAEGRCCRCSGLLAPAASLL